jgi:hypothetical protein
VPLQTSVVRALLPMFELHTADQARAYDLDEYEVQDDEGDADRIYLQMALPSDESIQPHTVLDACADMQWVCASKHGQMSAHDLVLQFYAKRSDHDRLPVKTAYWRDRPNLTILIQAKREHSATSERLSAELSHLLHNIREFVDVHPTDGVWSRGLVCIAAAEKPGESTNSLIGFTSVGHITIKGFRLQVKVINHRQPIITSAADTRTCRMTPAPARGSDRRCRIASDVSLGDFILFCLFVPRVCGAVMRMKPFPVT